MFYLPHGRTARNSSWPKTDPWGRSSFSSRHSGCGRPQINQRPQLVRRRLCLTDRHEMGYTQILCGAGPENRRMHALSGIPTSRSTVANPAGPDKASRGAPAGAPRRRILGSACFGASLVRAARGSSALTLASLLHPIGRPSTPLAAPSRQSLQRDDGVFNLFPFLPQLQQNFVYIHDFLSIRLKLQPVPLDRPFGLSPQWHRPGTAEAGSPPVSSENRTRC